MSVTETKNGQAYFGLGGGVGIGGGLTFAPGYVDSGNKSALSQQSLSNFVSGWSAVGSAGAGYLGAGEQWGNVGHWGWKNFSTEPGIQTFGAGVSLQMSYSWKIRFDNDLNRGPYVNCSPPTACFPGK
jgi:hypothetical protein